MCSCDRLRVRPRIPFLRWSPDCWGEGYGNSGARTAPIVLTCACIHLGSTEHISESLSRMWLARLSSRSPPHLQHILVGVETRSRPGAANCPNLGASMNIKLACAFALCSSFHEVAYFQWSSGLHDSLEGHCFSFFPLRLA